MSRRRYSYALSTLFALVFGICRPENAQQVESVGTKSGLYPLDTAISKGVDNWDANQDDLRRFMELDPSNRRYLLTTSAQTAHKYGAYFIPPMLHCVDCIPAKVVGDKCEIRPDGKTEYDAVTCGDIPAIKETFTTRK